MPIGYLTTVSLIALCTAFAVAPPRPRRSSPSNVGYWFGFVLNELPFIALYWLLAATLLVIGQHDLDSPVGWTAFCLAVVTTAGLVVVVVRGLRAAPATDHALSDALGTDWRTAIDSQFADRLRRARSPWSGAKARLRMPESRPTGLVGRESTPDGAGFAPDGCASAGGQVTSSMVIRISDIDDPCTTWPAWRRKRAMNDASLITSFISRSSSASDV